MSDERDPKHGPKAAAGATPEPRVPELLVEKLALGELAEDEAKALHARLAGEPDGLARLAALRSSNDEVLAAYPVVEMARDIEARLRVARARADEPSPRAGARRSSWWLGLPALAAAAAVLLIVLPRTLPLERTSSERLSSDGEPGADSVRTKGLEARLQVFLRSDGEPRTLRSGDVAQAGDVLQLAYLAAGEPYGAIVSVDGAGEVTLHLPAESGAQAAAALEQQGLVNLSHAYELDDAPGFERFFFVTSSSPFDVQVVTSAARALAGSGAARQATLSLPVGLSQSSALVVKGTTAAER